MSTSRRLPALPWSGFAARTRPAVGVHDPLSVRALAVGDTAIVVVDIVGLHEAMCRRVRARCPLPAENIVVSALHTHGGPVVSTDRAGGDPDAAYVERLEDACVGVAHAAASPAAELTSAPAPIRKWRATAGMPTGPSTGAAGAAGARHGRRPIAVVASYACHPVVLGPDNNMWTADYPHFVRHGLERPIPGPRGVPDRLLRRREFRT